MKHLLTFGLAFELHHHPSPNTSVMKQTARSTLEVLLRLGGEMGKKIKGVVRRLHFPKHLAELIHVTRAVCFHIQLTWPCY